MGGAKRNSQGTLVSSSPTYTSLQLAQDLNRYHAAGDRRWHPHSGDDSSMTTSAEPQASAIRPDLRNSISGIPSSPHTPQRGASPFQSPGLAHQSLRRSEDNRVIFELGSRFLSAGHEGEAAPQCITKFGQEETRRHGDYRAWQAPVIKELGPLKDLEKWGDDCELWGMDLKNHDLAYLGDKLERAFRLAHANHLLTGPGDNRLALVIPSVLPKQIIASILSRLFNRWKYSSIMLLPSPTMATVSAGLRSALVIDIGWRETIVTAIYECREIYTMRTTRAMRLLTQEMGRQFIPDSSRDASDSSLPFGFEFAEDLVFRLAWCRELDLVRKKGAAGVNKQMRRSTSSETSSKLPHIAEDTESDTDHQEEIQHNIASPDPSENLAPAETVQIKIDWPAASALTDSEAPFSAFAEPAERAFFDQGLTRQSFDDDETPLPELVFKTLLALPADVRAICMSRLVFIGGGSKVPGLSHRIISEVGWLLEKYGWDGVRGSKVDDSRNKHREASPKNVSAGEENREVTENADQSTNTEVSTDHPTLRSTDKDAVKKPPSEPVHGVLRQVNSLGPWVGASLINSLKVRGVVEIEREEFLQYGLARSQRNGEASVVPKRMSYGANVAKGTGDRSSWTLAGWA
ncbi:MAG: hypothetical protein Q9160_006272 [Pyrenula sp. 1 TL-2023]